jgi:hypothetical protein
MDSHPWKIGVTNEASELSQNFTEAVFGGDGTTPRAETRVVMKAPE